VTPASPPSPDPLMGQADSLVATAKAAATQAYAPMFEQFGFLREFISSDSGKKRWHLIVTIAGVYIAAARLRNFEFGEAREQMLMTRVSNRLEQWDLVNARPCFENCKTFFGQNFELLTQAGHEERFVASDTIGLWIAWSIMNRAPAEQEWEFVRTIGVALTHGFFSWWNGPKPN
jgi:hypothetical protein